jgi:hypothetical protein
MASAGMGVPAVYVVKFTDCIRYIPVHDVKASSVSIGGCSRTVKSETDVEPVISIPVASMRSLGSPA